MSIDYFWDRDTDLLVYRISGVRDSAMCRAIFYCEVEGGYTPVTASILRPAEQGAYLGAVPVRRLKSERCRIRAFFFTREQVRDKAPEFTPTSMLDDEIVLRRSRDIAAPVSSEWSFDWIDESWKLTRVTRISPVAAVGVTADQQLDDGSAAFTPMRPDGQYNGSASVDVHAAVEQHRSEKKMVCASLGRGNVIHPSSFEDRSRGSVAVIVRLKEGSSGSAKVSFSLAGGTRASVSLKTARLPIDKLGNVDLQGSLLDDLEREAEPLTLDPDVCTEHEFVLEDMATLDRIVVQQAAGGGVHHQSVPARRWLFGWFLPRQVISDVPEMGGDLPPVEFFAASHDGDSAYTSFGPVLSLANYSTCLEFDEVLSRVLSGEAWLDRMRHDGPRPARLFSPPVQQAIAAVSGRNGQARPDEDDFLAYSDRAFAPADDRALALDLSDDRSIMKAQVRASMPIKDDAELREILDWTDLVVKGGVPVDTVRALAIHPDLVDVIRFCAPVPSNGTGTDFGLAMESCAQGLAEKRPLVSLAQFFGIANPIGRGADVQAWVKWLDSLTQERLQDEIEKARPADQIDAGLADALKPSVMATYSGKSPVSLWLALLNLYLSLNEKALPRSASGQIDFHAYVDWYLGIIRDELLKLMPDAASKKGGKELAFNDLERLSLNILRRLTSPADGQADGPLERGFGGGIKSLLETQAAWKSIVGREGGK